MTGDATSLSHKRELKPFKENTMDSKNWIIFTALIDVGILLVLSYSVFFQKQQGT